LFTRFTTTPIPNLEGLRRRRFNVCSICYWWREVAIGTTSLWSQISVHYTPHEYESFHDEPNMPNPSPSLHIISKAAIRARSRPLSLYVCLIEPSEISDIYERDVLHAFRMTERLLGQCASLHLTVKIPDVEIPISTLFTDKTSLPHLHFLDLIISGQQSHFSPLGINLAQACHLKHLRLSLQTRTTPLLILPSTEQNQIVQLKLEGKMPLWAVASALQSCHARMDRLAGG